MIFGIPFSELAWLAVMVLIGGCVTGILAGLFGIGGGSVIVPVLFEVFRVLEVPEQVRMQLCIGTSLAIIVPTTWRSYRAHKAKGKMRTDVVRAWTLPALGGVVVGSVLAAFAPAAFFKIFFALFATGIGAKFLFGQANWRLADRLPGRATMTGYGFVIGLLSSLVGISGGALTNLFLTLYAVPIHDAVLVAAGIGVPITIAGTIGYIIAGWPHINLLPPLSVGFVSLIGFAIMAPVSSFTAGYGAKLAHKLERRQLEIVFGVFLWLVAVRIGVSLL